MRYLVDDYYVKKIKQFQIMKGSFVVKTLQPFRNQNKPSFNVEIKPQSVYFQYCQSNKIHTSELSLINNSQFAVAFSIIQPTQIQFIVKMKNSFLSPNSSQNITVCFHPKQQKIKYKDQFTISFDKEKENIFVPIKCQWKQKQKYKIKRTNSIQRHRTSINPLQSLKDTQNKKEYRMRPSSHLRSSKFKFVLLDSVKQSNVMNFFMIKYNKLEQYIKQKQIKNEIYLGEQAIQSDKSEQIVQFNVNTKQIAKYRLCQEVKNRFKVVFPDTGPIISCIHNLRVRWNKDKNNNKITFNQAMKKVQECIRKYIVNLRFERIYFQFRQYRAFEERNTEAFVKSKVQTEECVSRFTKKKGIFNSLVNYDLEFSKNSIYNTGPEIQYPQQYTIGVHIFEINQRIGFDNWIPLQQLSSHTHQIMRFNKKQLKQRWLSEPVLNKKNLSGAKEQCCIRNNAVQDTEQNLEQIIENIKISQSCNYQYACADQKYYRNYQLQEELSYMKPNFEEKINFNEAFSTLNYLNYIKQQAQPHFQRESTSIIDKEIKESYNSKTTYQVLGNSLKQDLFKVKQTTKFMQNLTLMAQRSKKSQQYRNGKINQFVDVFVVNYMKRQNKLQKAMQNLFNYKQFKLKQAFDHLHYWNSIIKYRRHKIII